MTAKKRRASKAAAPKVAAAAKADVAKKTRARRKSKPKKNGRPIAHTPAIARRICERLAAGDSLRTICQSKTMPAQSTVRLWVVDDLEGFSAQYERSRNVGLDVVADDVIHIADNPGGDVAKARLRFDARRWYLSKLAPKRYGDRLDLNVDAKVEVRELTDDQLEGRITGIVDNLIDKIGVLLTTKYRDKDEDR
jgi:hypothetical protein